jgi:hypothetical protein
LASQTVHALIRHGVADSLAVAAAEAVAEGIPLTDRVAADSQRIVYRRYGGVRYRKNTTLPLEKVTPLDG